LLDRLMQESNAVVYDASMGFIFDEAKPLRCETLHYRIQFNDGDVNLETL
jgi:hypothetical protein